MRLRFAAALAALFLTPAFAQSMMVAIEDPYARVATPSSPAAAAFMVLMNHGAEEDRLIGVASDIAKRVELHTHIDEGGVMKMRPVEDGFTVPAGGMHALKRGGDHVMMMGLNRRLAHGDEIELTLIFEKAGEITITIPVDIERKADEGMSMEHDSSDGHSGHSN